MLDFVRRGVLHTNVKWEISSTWLVSALSTQTLYYNTGAEEERLSRADLPFDIRM